MSKDCVFSYKLDVYYNRENQFTVSWNDPSIGIWWPIDDPILSERDALL
jgi:dTDP-4-dehydrorhamnose 3,5-epimerase-like enzyme